MPHLPPSSRTQEALLLERLTCSRMLAGKAALAALWAAAAISVAANAAVAAAAVDQQQLSAEHRQLLS